MCNYVGEQAEITLINEKLVEAVSKALLTTTKVIGP